MKNIIKFIVICLLLTSCEHYLDKKDLTGVDEGLIWNDEATATLFLNKTYAMVMPAWPNMRSAATLPTPIHNISDESNFGDNRPLYGTVGVEQVNDFMGANNSNAYLFIRRLNIILQDIEAGTIPQDGKNRIKGQAYFLRAWVYFNLVKVHGGVPIITHPQDWQEDDLRVARNKTSECIDFIIEDLDMAAQLLQNGLPATMGSDRGRVTRDAALAMKGRILLYWASAQFNPQVDQARWERAYQANKAAYDELTQTGYALFPSFEGVLTNSSANNREVIFLRSYDGASVPNTFEHQARPFSQTANGGGQHHPTWNLVKAFPMKNGKPAYKDGEALNGFDTLYYWKDRDPRFYATVAYNGAIWELSNQSNRKQWNYRDVAEDRNRQTSTGFYCRKGVNPSTLAVDSNRGTTDWVEMRFAEVILNLAESANATGRIAEAYDLVKMIRQRAGITNEDGNYGLEAGMGREEMDEAIMEERRIEFAFEGKRYDDLRRTRRFHLLNGQRREALLIQVKAPFTAAQLEAPDEFGVRLREKLNLDTDYETYFQPAYAVLDTQFPINFQQNYYFYGIATSHIARNENLQQTLGWDPVTEAGYFDPLD
ncbi:RagB/SusD family nutrient uptake outer membrane protein [Belliella marina]|uniref:RagB/SusD family nutrient uptake outer membrane protein n=1 Tax=Belliella marina TaxID=1644146 RepID=A0ABW4VM40_9BACT